MQQLIWLHKAGVSVMLAEQHMLAYSSLSQCRHFLVIPARTAVPAGQPNLSHAGMNDPCYHQQQKDLLATSTTFIDQQSLADPHMCPLKFDLPRYTLQSQAV